MVNKVEKMGLESNIDDIVNKYIDTNKSKVKNFSAGTAGVTAFNDKASKTYATVIIAGKKIKLEEGSLAYEKLKGHILGKFLFVGEETYINPDHIQEFQDIDFSTDYATLDVEKEEIHAHQEVDPNWRDVFGDVNE